MLWDGDISKTPDKLDQWLHTLARWSGAVAAGGGRTLRVFITYPNQQPCPLFRIELQDARPTSHRRKLQANDSCRWMQMCDALLGL